MREPVGKDEISGSNIDVMLVPMIGFNDKKNRLGFGFNYYNDYLTDNDKIFTIGLAYQLQLNNSFVTSSRDKILDMIITEKRPS
jgi:5-formyltetrahydrofolate cyclo-ligase